MARVTIIGLGNRMRGDDAMGLLALDALAGQSLGDGIELAQAADDPIRLIDMLAETDAAIFMDAADMKAAPGTLRVFRDESEWTSVQPLSSIHSMGLQQIVPMARKLGIQTRVVLVAVQAADWSFGRQPSPQVLQQLTELKDTVLKEARDALEGIDHR